jgi:hypothetical protein
LFLIVFNESIGFSKWKLQMPLILVILITITIRRWHTHWKNSMWYLAKENAFWLLVIWTNYLYTSDK